MQLALFVPHIIQATLTLTPWYLAADFNTTYHVGAFQNSWSPSTITANNAPAWWIGGSVNVPTSGLPVNWDVTAIVQNWANGAWSNYGFALGDDNLSFPFLTALRATGFCSLNIWDFQSQRPVLTITLQ